MPKTFTKRPEVCDNCAIFYHCELAASVGNFCPEKIRGQHKISTQAQDPIPQPITRPATRPFERELVGLAQTAYDLVC